MYATVIEVAEINGQYGMEKKSRVQLDDGESKTVYTKPKVADIYNALRPGIRVELMPKNSGTGYLIKSIIGEATDTPPAAPNGQAPARAGRQEPSREEIGAYIETKAGQYFYAYKCLKEKFDNDKDGILVTEDTIRQAAATVIISLDRHFW